MPYADVRLPTLLDAARNRYVRGEVELDEFERIVEELIFEGKDADPDFGSWFGDFPAPGATVMVPAGFELHRL